MSEFTMSLPIKYLNAFKKNTKQEVSANASGAAQEINDILLTSIRKIQFEKKIAADVSAGFYSRNPRQSYESSEEKLWISKKKNRIENPFSEGTDCRIRQNDLSWPYFLKIHMYLQDFRAF